MKSESNLNLSAPRKAYLTALVIVLASASGAFVMATSLMGLHHFF